MSTTLLGLLRDLVGRLLSSGVSGPPSHPASHPAPRPSLPVPPPAGTPGLDSLLPPLVGSWPRTHLNDRFGGLDQGGVHAAYDVDGHPVRVLVRRSSSDAQARGMVAGAPAGPGSAAWSRGRLWTFVSGGRVEGDEDPTFAPGDVEAVDRFTAALRRLHGEEA